MKHVQNTTTSKNNDNCNLAPQPKLEDNIILGDELKSSFTSTFLIFTKFNTNCINKTNNCYNQTCACKQKQKKKGKVGGVK